MPDLQAQLDRLYDLYFHYWHMAEIHPNDDERWNIQARQALQEINDLYDVIAQAQAQD